MIRFLRIENSSSPTLTLILVIAKLASMNLEELQTKAGAAETLLKALANRNRLVTCCTSF